ncbi:MAG: glycosyltransferase family 2 protein [Vicinamibacteria bacterium]
MAEARETSVVIPAFNEAEGIANTIHGLKSQGFAEILVVDDGSTDATVARAEEAGARVVRHPYNKGNGAAVKSGIREAKSPVILLMDADTQHDPAEAAKIIGPIGAYDMVIGARSLSHQSLLRATGNAVFRSLASWLTGRPIPDLTSGYRAAKRTALLEILHLLPNGFSYPTTSCLALMKSGQSVLFVPITARARVGTSKIRPLQDGFRFILIIFKIVTLYAPLRVFAPISIASIITGIAYGIWNVMKFDKIPMGSALLIQLGVVVFLFGLISEQIASMQDRR